MQNKHKKIAKNNIYIAFYLRKADNHLSKAAMLA
jgi:hypothetical protein